MKKRDTPIKPADYDLLKRIGLNRRIARIDFERNLRQDSSGNEYEAITLIVHPLDHLYGPDDQPIPGTKDPIRIPQRLVIWPNVIEMKLAAFGTISVTRGHWKQVEEWDAFCAENEADMAEYERLKKKLGL